MPINVVSKGKIIAGPNKGKTMRERGAEKARTKKMGGGMMKKPMMKKGGMAKLNPGLKAYLMKKKKKK